METWIQFGITLISMMSLFIWVRTESRTDIRHMDNKMDSIRELVNAIHMEVKDFHNRMADLEKKK